MQQKDQRLDKVEQITIDFEVYKKAVTRNYLEPAKTMFEQNHSFVLRLMPPFEAEMVAQYYESEQGRHYNNEWNEKPHHIKPELILLEGTEADTNPFKWIEYPTERTQREHLTEQEIEDEGGIEECLKQSREIYWSEIAGFLLDTFVLGTSVGDHVKEVQINWTNV
jgi:hypothetical protein